MYVCVFVLENCARISLRWAHVMISRLQVHNRRCCIVTTEQHLCVDADEKKMHREQKTCSQNDVNQSNGWTAADSLRKNVHCTATENDVNTDYSFATNSCALSMHSLSVDSCCLNLLMFSAPLTAQYISRPNGCANGCGRVEIRLECIERNEKHTPNQHVALCACDSAHNIHIEFFPFRSVCTGGRPLNNRHRSRSCRILYVICIV